MSDLVGLIEWGGFGSFIIILSAIWAGERTVKAIINRNKPDCNCQCCTEGETETEEEVP